jgi:hypothetical protein
MSHKVLKILKAQDSQFHEIAQKMDNELYEEEQRIKNSLESFIITSTCVPQVGDTVVQTTADSSFNFDGATGQFGQEAVSFYKVFGEVVDEDYSNYDPKLCNNGGKYGFTSIKVLLVE